MGGEPATVRRARMATLSYSGPVGAISRQLPRTLPRTISHQSLLRGLQNYMKTIWGLKFGTRDRSDTVQRRGEQEGEQTGAELSQS